jgi:hypothetical protein
VLDAIVLAVHLADALDEPAAVVAAVVLLARAILHPGELARGDVAGEERGGVVVVVGDPLLLVSFRVDEPLGERPASSS